MASRTENTEIDHVYMEACYMKGEKFSSYLTHMESVLDGLKWKCILTGVIIR